MHQEQCKSIRSSYGCTPFRVNEPDPLHDTHFGNYIQTEKVTD